jgi:hypothetical protein
LCPSLSPPPSHSHYASPDGRHRQFKALRSPVAVFFYPSFVHSTRTGHPRSLSSSQRTLRCSPAELPFQIVMSVPELGNLRLCSCCNRVVSRQTAQRHQKNASLPVLAELPSQIVMSESHEGNPPSSIYAVVDAIVQCPDGRCGVTIKPLLPSSCSLNPVGTRRTKLL